MTIGSGSISESKMIFPPMGGRLGGRKVSMGMIAGVDDEGGDVSEGLDATTPHAPPTSLSLVDVTHHCSLPSCAAPEHPVQVEKHGGYGIRGHRYGDHDTVA